METDTFWKNVITDIKPSDNVLKNEHHLKFFSFRSQKHRKMAKVRYYTDSNVFLADSVDLPDISNFFADILTFFHDGWKFEKSHGGAPPGRGVERRPKRGVKR